MITGPVGRTAQGAPSKNIAPDRFFCRNAQAVGAEIEHVVPKATPVAIAITRRANTTIPSPGCPCVTARPHRQATPPAELRPTGAGLLRSPALMSAGYCVEWLMAGQHVRYMPIRWHIGPGMSFSAVFVRGVEAANPFCAILCQTILPARKTLAVAPASPWRLRDSRRVPGARCRSRIRFGTGTDLAGWTRDELVVMVPHVHIGKTPRTRPLQVARL